MLFEWIGNDLQKYIFNVKPEGRRKRGRPKLKWEDGVDNDVKAQGAVLPLMIKAQR